MRHQGAVLEAKRRGFVPENRDIDEKVVGELGTVDS